MAPSPRSGGTKEAKLLPQAAHSRSHPAAAALPLSAFIPPDGQSSARRPPHPRSLARSRAHTHIHEYKSPPHTSMCSRAGPRAGCGALKVARDVTASQARRTDVNIDVDIYMYLYLKEGGSNIEMHRGMRATFNGRFDFACVFFYAPSLC